MNLLFSLVIFLASPLVLANDSFDSNHPWKGLIGCYKTLEWNGKKIKDVPENLSVFEQEEDWILTDLKNKPIDSLVMLIFQTCENDECVYDYSTAFTKLGKYSGSSLKTFNYQGELIYLEELKVKVKMTVTYKKLSGNRVKLMSQREVKSTDGDFDANDSYILRSVKCPEDAKKYPQSHEVRSLITI